MPASLHDPLAALAIELETLAQAGALDDAAGADVLAACQCDGPSPLAAGLLLFFCCRAERAVVERLWLGVAPAERTDLVIAMVSLHAEAAVRALGTELLGGCLRAAQDRTLHSRIARALCATAVAECERLLPVLLDPARGQLAFALGERAGRSDDGIPAWAGHLPKAAQAQAVAGFAMGTLMTGRARPFAATAGLLPAAGWQTFAEAIGKRLIDLNGRAMDMLAPYRDRLSPHIPAWAEPASVAARAPRATATLGASPAEQALELVRQAEEAGADELVSLLAAAQALRLPTWRAEACRAVLRRAAYVRAPLCGLMRGLPRRVVIEDLIAGRLAGGDASVVRRRGWTRLDREVRFRLLDSAIADLAARQRRSDDTVACLVAAIVEIGEPLRGILATKLVDALADWADLTPSMFDAMIAGGVSPDTLTAIGRAHALRGEHVLADNLMSLARERADAVNADDSQRRLTDLLAGGDIPVDRVAAVSSLLAAAPDRELPRLVRICADRLPDAARDLMMAGIVVQGRASVALGMGG
jgi:hypothetical protein